MKKIGIKSLLSFLLAFTIFTSCATPIFADNDDDKTEEAKNAVDIDLGSVEIGDQFKDSEGITYTVSDDAANIYVGSGDNQKKYKTGSVETFEITYKTKNGNATYGVNDPDALDTYRKYIKLETLCDLTKKDGTKICEIMDQTDEDAGEFYLKRLYKEKIYSSNVKTVHSDDLDMDVNIPDAKEVSLYYKSYHTTKSKEFSAMLELVDEDGDDIDTYIFEESDQVLEEAGKWDEGYMTTDIETLIDKNDEVYVSLRFVSESLGAEVRWLSEEDSKDGSDDDVYIEFYDDKEYCKDIEYTFTGNGHEVDPEEFEKSLYVTKESELENISLNGTYTYTDTDGEKQTSTIDWKNLYILLTIPSNYPDGFLDQNKSLQESILWVIDDDDSTKNYLWAKRALYGEYSSDDGQCTIGDTTYDCDLGEKIDISGIILYKGVPIPIDLFNVNDSVCTNN